MILLPIFCVRSLAIVNTDQPVHYFPKSHCYTSYNSGTGISLRVFLWKNSQWICVRSLGLLRIYPVAKRNSGVAFMESPFYVRTQQNLDEMMNIPCEWVRRYLQFQLNAQQKINSNLLKAKGGIYAKSREFFPFIVATVPFSLTAYTSSPFCHCFLPRSVWPFLSLFLWN